jgi:hypothetical protein
MSRGYPIVAFPGLGVNAVVQDNAWYAFTPQIQIVGAGAAPNYVTNQGRFMIANNVVRCDILFDGDGGTPGSGAGILNISLPALPSPLRLAGFLNVGYYTNNNNSSVLLGTPTSGTPWMGLSYLITTGAGAPNIADFTGAQQNNATRTIRAHFWYECDQLPP